MRQSSKTQICLRISRETLQDAQFQATLQGITTSELLRKAIKLYCESQALENNQQLAVVDGDFKIIRFLKMAS